MATVTDDVPIAGQALTMGGRVSGDPAVLSVHGVRRVEGGSIVYYSLAFPEDGDLGVAEKSLFAPLAINSAGGLYRQGYSVAATCDTAAIDQAGRVLYGPLGDDTGINPALCSAAPDVAAGEARVAAVAVAPIPPDVTLVDVSISGTLIPDVPVEDGALLPAAEDTSAAPLLGMGWPVLDHVAMAAEDPAVHTYPLIQAVSDVRGEITDTRDALQLSGDVLFAKNSAIINPDGSRVLQDAADALKAKDVNGTLVVIGHTDSDGDDAENQTLSEQRAAAVAAALGPLLGSSVTVETVGRGESEPIASNDSDEGKTLNRRVTLDFTPQDNS